MFSATKEEIQTAISQLEQAIHNHDEWFEEMNRSMLCRLPLDQRDMRENAHKECRFGQWVYQHASRKIRQHPAFRAIEKEHQNMHADARAMLLNLDECGATATDRYDRYSSSLRRLRLEINTLKEELQSILYNLDSLTGANTRIGMLTHLREQRELSKRNAPTFSIAMLDLDNFKEVNDRYGHQVGDQVLKAVSRYILDNIRPYDRFYRYGGEEFLLSMPQTELATATEIAERLRKGIDQFEIPLGLGEGDPLRITVSFGVAALSPEFDVEEIINHADRALYQAKHLGRNQVCTWPIG